MGGGASSRSLRCGNFVFKFSRVPAAVSQRPAAALELNAKTQPCVSCYSILAVIISHFRPHRGIDHPILLQLQLLKRKVCVARIKLGLSCEFPSIRDVHLAFNLSCTKVGETFDIIKISNQIFTLLLFASRCKRSKIR